MARWQATFIVILIAFGVSAAGSHAGSHAARCGEWSIDRAGKQGATPNVP